MSVTTLHPRYQGIWEQPDADYPDEDPKDWVRPERHDFSERRWLTPEHRDALDRGELDVPERTQSEHVAVLVSVPHSVSGEPVSWIDRGLAEVVLLAHLAGLNVQESCEDADGAPTVWFDRRCDLDDFHRAVGVTTGRLSGPRARFLRHLIRRGGSFPAMIRADEMPRVVARLREASA